MRICRFSSSVSKLSRSESCSVHTGQNRRHKMESLLSGTSIDKESRNSWLILVKLSRGPDASKNFESHAAQLSSNGDISSPPISLLFPVSTFDIMMKMWWSLTSTMYVSMWWLVYKTQFGWSFGPIHATLFFRTRRGDLHRQEAMDAIVVDRKERWAQKLSTK